MIAMMKSTESKVWDGNSMPCEVAVTGQCSVQYMRQSSRDRRCLSVEDEA